jgi:hypothetical protein
MKVRELPQSVQDELRELLPDQWDIIAGLELEEFAPYTESRLEDIGRRRAHRQRWSNVEREIDQLVEPLVRRVGDLPLEQLSWFLRGADRQRYEELMRELKELSQPVFVTHGREPWHQAVENAVPSGTLYYTSQDLMRRHLDQIVASVMRQDFSWPEDRVRRYAQYLIETASGIELTGQPESRTP